MISIVILTLNEEINLPRCLDSVAWSDDILVVDSGSTDRTLEIARAAGARIIERKFDSFSGQRNHAMVHGAFRNEWVLHLDADEVVPADLRVELQAIAGKEDLGTLIYRLPSKLIFMGHWLRHAGMYPAYQVRLGRRDALRFVDYGHGQREVSDGQAVGTCSAALDHYNFSKGINDWFTRHIRYAQLEAQQAIAETDSPLEVRQLADPDPTLRRRALKRLAYRMPLRPLMRFLYIYIAKRGFLDGVAGFRYAAMLGVYQYMIDLNERELRLGP